MMPVNLLKLINRRYIAPFTYMGKHLNSNEKKSDMLFHLWMRNVARDTASTVVLVDKLIDLLK